jgi:hypothetical protein
MAQQQQQQINGSGAGDFSLDDSKKQGTRVFKKSIPNSKVFMNDKYFVNLMKIYLDHMLSRKKRLCRLYGSYRSNRWSSSSRSGIC